MDLARSYRKVLNRGCTTNLHRLKLLHESGLLGLAVKGELGTWLTRLGEAVGSKQLIYNSLTYAGFHRFAMEAAPTFVAGVLRIYPDCQAAVDLGCGTGVYVAQFRNRGVDCEGYEYSAEARKIAWEKLKLKIEPFDVATFDPISTRRDLCLSLELGEHLSPELGDRLVKLCVSTAPRVVFSAAHPGQGGHGHINEQPKPYWISRFKAHGFGLNESATLTLERYLRQHLTHCLWLADNVMILQEIEAFHR